MKIWLKYLIAILLGVIFTISAGTENTFFVKVVELLSQFSIRFGRYALYPAVFFAFTVSIFELRENKNLFKLAINTIIFVCFFSFLLAFIGILSVLIRTPVRIPIFVEGTEEAQVLGILESFLKLFPSTAFEAFIDGAFILPLCIFAGFAGAGCAVDRSIAKPTLTLFDSLARVSYAIMVFFIDMFAFAMIALSASWIIQFRSMFSSGVFTGFILTLTGNFVFITFILYPALIKLCCPEINPYRVLYAGLAPMAAAFISGDAHIALSVLMQHSNESLGIRRRISSVATPIFSIFGRAGSAMAITVSFIVIVKSYSSLGIGMKDMVWLTAIAALFSFFLGRFPIGGTYIALASVCMLYGRGFEAGYLILRPAAFFIGSIASAINALTALTGTYIIAYRFKMTRTKELRFFI
ncbi:MAG: dicarboxylate/amino acid:cation symporter [Treponema sp.]